MTGYNKNKTRPCSASQAVGNSCRVRNIRCNEIGGSRHRDRLGRIEVMMI